MSDDTEPLSDDELVSAVLDGSATPAQVDRVMGDRDLAARLARFRVIGAAVAEPVPALGDDTVDELIANAIDRAGHDTDADDDVAAAEAGVGDAAPAPSGVLPDWAEHGGPRRAKRPGSAADRSRGGFRRVPPLAAAALLLVIAGVGLYLALSSRADRNRHSASTASSPLVAGSSGDTAAGAGSGAAATAAPASGAVWLGSYATQDELNQALTNLDPRTLQPASTAGSFAAAGGSAPPPGAGSYLPSAADLNRCDHVIRTGVARALTNQRAIGGAQIAGRNVMVLSYDAPASGNKPAGVAVIAADQASCYPLLEQDH